MPSQTILYSFRRCPYAMRARLALWQSGIAFELREIVLRDKPQPMLDASPKGTVPVLVLDTSAKTGIDKPVVIDESLDIMLWALTQKDPNQWLPTDSNALHSALDSTLGNALDSALAFVERNDSEFKGWLDKYKYFDRFPEHPQQYYRQQGEVFLRDIETRLNASAFLSGERFGFLDAAIAPFVRQFAHVDLEWFEHCEYERLKTWLNDFKASELFLAIMKKFPVWQQEDEPLFINQQTISSSEIAQS